jgi:hypothetical protein
VRLLRSSTEIILEVSDEGKGLDQETQSKISSGETTGVGLRGMRERVRQLGGTVEVQSNGHGTTVIAKVPVEESSRNVASPFSDNGHKSRDHRPAIRSDLSMQRSKGKPPLGAKGQTST